VENVSMQIYLFGKLKKIILNSGELLKKVILPPCNKIKNK